ncbi:MAG: DUF3560 domain-containing protein, partial [Sandaracinaceae bacterium]|nr:DUF3560 domain-containing protein [Sandaracinaceae bacterium]
MSHYDDKLEARRTRLQARADKAQAKARAAAGKADSIASMIPMGQPILVGHHSERRHRKHLGEIDRAMRTAIEASDEAEELRRRARRVGSAGVSADDPNAIDKLEAKIAQIERDRDEAKKVNAAYREGGWEAVAKLGVIGPEDVLALGAAMEHLPRGMRVPYPAYVFQNVSSELRRLRERVEALKKGPIGFDPVEGDGWRLEARPDLNRVALSFDRRPDKSVTEALRRGGWRWSPREGAWLRMLNNTGVNAAELLIARLFGWRGTITRRFGAATDSERSTPEVLVPLIEPMTSAAPSWAPPPSVPQRAFEQLGLDWG